MDLSWLNLDVDLVGDLLGVLLDEDLLNSLLDGLSLMDDLNDDLLWCMLDDLLENYLELMDLVLDGDELLLDELSSLNPLLSVMLLALSEGDLENGLLGYLDFDLLDNLNSLLDDDLLLDNSVVVLLVVNLDWEVNLDLLNLDLLNVELLDQLLDVLLDQNLSGVLNNLDNLLSENELDLLWNVL